MSWNPCRRGERRWETRYCVIQPPYSSLLSFDTFPEDSRTCVQSGCCHSALFPSPLNQDGSHLVLGSENTFYLQVYMLIANNNLPPGDKDKECTASSKRKTACLVCHPVRQRVGETPVGSSTDTGIKNWERLQCPVLNVHSDSGAIYLFIFVCLCYWIVIVYNSE